MRSPQAQCSPARGLQARRPHTGFTLLELMFSIAIVAILTAIAVPSFREYTRNSSAAAAQNALITAFNLAKSAAITRSMPVSVCPSTDGASCAGSAADWGSGWMVFTDTGTSGKFDGDDVKIQVWPAVQHSINVTADASSGSAKFIQFEPTGTIEPIATLTFGFSWTGCTGKHVHQINVSPIGALSATLEDCP